MINKPFAGGYWVGTHEDISERRRAERELERTKSFLDKIVENVPATIVVKDAQDLRYILVNRAGERYYGLPRDQLIGKNAYDLFPPATARFVMESDRELIASGREDFTDRHAIETPGNGTRIVTTSRLPIAGDDGKPQYLLAVIDDVTERKQAEDRIAYMAHHDPLTDLPNRAAFTDHLRATLQKAAEANDGFAVMCLNLDRFKEVNDVCGHSVGDALLREVARRLKEAAGEAVVARLGSDEFAIISAGGPAEAGALAERLLARLTGDLAIEEHQIRIGVSIGRRPIRATAPTPAPSWAMPMPRSAASRRKSGARSASSIPPWINGCASGAPCNTSCRRRCTTASSSCTTSRKPRSTAKRPASKR